MKKQVFYDRDIVWIESGSYKDQQGKVIKWLASCDQYEVEVVTGVRIVLRDDEMSLITRHEV